MGTGVDALPYVDALIKEYLLFRGFTATLSAFNKDLSADPGCGFQAERITELIFRQLIPSLDCQQLVEFLEYLNMQLYSRLDSRYEPLVSAVEADLLRLFLVTAHRAGRPDCMAEFFRLYGPQLISNSSRSSSSNISGGGFGGQDAAAGDWREWFLLPYLQNPDKEPRFQLYFSSEWASLLEVSFRNFIAGVVRSLPLPAVLRFNTDRRLRLALQQQVHALQSELERTRQQLDSALQTLQQQEQQQQAVPRLPTLQEGLDSASAQQQQQQQQQQHKSSVLQDSSRRTSSTPAQTTSAFLPGANSSTYSAAAGADQGTAEGPAPLRSVPGSRAALTPIGGSGLFELLPQHSGPGVLPGTAGSSGAGSSAAGGVVAPGVPRHMGGHTRGTSFSGSISFDALSAAAVLGAEAQAEGEGGDTAAPDEQDTSITQHTETDPQHEYQQQQQQQPEDKIGRPIPHSAVRSSSRSSAASSGSLPPALAIASLGPGPNPHSIPTPRSSSTIGASGVPLSTSPVLSWAGGGSSSSGVRARHIPPAGISATAGFGGNAGNGGGLAGGLGVVQPPAVTVQALTAVPASSGVTVAYQQHQPGPAAAGASAGEGSGAMQGCVAAVAFSPSGGNIASVVAGSSSVHIWSPAGLPGNAARAAVVGCGAPVTCVSWDSRADKLMLIGCAAGGGVRAWHADTRRIMDSVPAEPGFPVVAAVGACPSEPTFVVAANSTDSASSFSTQQQQQQPQGRLVTYNARSFKRSSVLAVPPDTGLVSLAYSSSGAQLVVGTATGTALMYEPNSRTTPLCVWNVATAVTERAPAVAAAVGDRAVQVLWRPPGAVGRTSSGSGGGGGAGSMLTLCSGVLCEWVVSGSSSSTRPPVAAFDVVAAAQDALSVQNQPMPAVGAAEEPVGQQQGHASGGTPLHVGSVWCCGAAVSPDGSSLAVLCSADVAGVLLLLRATSADGDAGGREVLAAGGRHAWSGEASVLLAGSMLAGCAAALSWHSGGRVLVVGGKGSSSITIGLPE